MKAYNNIVKETRVNAGVWSVLKPRTQTEDFKIIGIQNVVKASVNIAKEHALKETRVNAGV